MDVEDSDRYKKENIFKKPVKVITKNIKKKFLFLNDKSNNKQELSRLYKNESRYKILDK